MATVKFTPSQQEVIDARKCNLLVSAAAGSGKTAVLVERILALISEGVDVDTLLVVTFTEAAAAEMRERIGKTMRAKLQENPSDKHLQKQMVLLHNAQITTIHGFCLQLLKNHFQDIDLQPGFRVADEGEIALLQNDVCAQVLEEYYALSDESFLAFAERYAPVGDTVQLMDIVLKLYKDSTSHAFPEEFFKQCMEDLTYSSVEEMEQSSWMRIIREYETAMLNDLMEMTKKSIDLATQDDGPAAYYATLADDYASLHAFAEEPSFSVRYRRISNWEFAALPAKREASETVKLIKTQIQGYRKAVKEGIEDLRKKIYMDEPEKMLTYQNQAGDTVRMAVEITRRFSEEFALQKREKNIIDFDDMEHLALQILLQNEEGKMVASPVAKEYRSFFSEVMTDEYQDSNEVQELLLWAVSGEEEGKNNRFMVGDVKQSIYRFRLAKPEIFMQKYHTYIENDDKNRKIVLSKNFRSRKEVIDSVNFLFERIMTKAVGNVDYDADARLYLGADYPQTEFSNNQTEVLILEKKNKGAEEEALMVAEKIQEMVGNTLVTDTSSKELRPAMYKDIVILLRTARNTDTVFKKTLEQCGIPAFISSRSGYFGTWEIRLLMNYITLLVNPRQDIPLLGVMHSFIGGFSETDIAQIRSFGNTKELLIDSLSGYEKSNEDELAGRIRSFIDEMNEYRDCCTYLQVYRLLETIIERKHVMEYLAAMPGGAQRCANVNLLLSYAKNFEESSYSGLFDFIRYMELLQKNDVDFGEANISDEGANVVRIMTIHKSKGLEFPICFVSMLGKQFNSADERNGILTDSDIGIGNKYINLEDRYQVDTLRRNAICYKKRSDSRGEDFRVLYVAMTRAKEKLILTGRVSNWEKAQTNAESVASLSDTEVSYAQRIKAVNYLDLILPVYAADKKSCVKVTFRTPEMLQGVVNTQMIQKSLLEKDLMTGQVNKENADYWMKRFTYNYPYESLRDLYIKTSVSELKHAAMETEDEEVAILFAKEESMPYVPNFMKEQEDEAGGSMRGSAYHRVMEILKFDGLPDFGNKKEISLFYQEERNRMVSSERITESMLQLVNTYKAELFLQSNLAHRMAVAMQKNVLYREQPFVLGVPANLLKETFPKQETLLIQGVIDAYFEEEGEVVLLDYKTDRVDTAEELVRRYKTQLDYYETALQRLTGKPVKEKLIYSFALGCVISL